MVRPTLWNLVVVTGLALVGIYGLRWVTRVLPVPGLSQLAGGV